MYEGLVCACCLATEELLELEAAYPRALAACFNIQLLAKDGHSNICAECARRLLDADTFRRQVLATLSVLTPNAAGGWLKVKREPKHVEEVVSKANSSRDMLEQRKTNRKLPAKEVVTKSPSKRHKNSCIRRVPIETSKTPKCPTYKLERTETSCRECPAAFDSHHALKQHINEHYPNFRCQECGKEFMTRTRWWAHQRIHKPGQFSCNKCEKVFNNENSLFSHKRNTHSAKRPLHACGACGQRFETFHKRLTHMRLQHGLHKVYPCPHCEKTFSYTGSRSKHIRESHDTRLYGCPLCSYRSKRKYLKAHLANKHQVGEKRNVCPSCGKRYSRRVTLKEHMRIHLSDKRFKCQFCFTCFLQKGTLKMHIQNHLKRGEITQEELLGADLESMDIPTMSTDEMINLLTKVPVDSGETYDATGDIGNDETAEKYAMLNVEDMNQEYLDDEESEECGNNEGINEDFDEYCVVEMLDKENIS